MVPEGGSQGPGRVPGGPLEVDPGSWRVLGGGSRVLGGRSWSPEVEDPEDPRRDSLSTAPLGSAPRMTRTRIPVFPGSEDGRNRQSQT